MNDVQTYHNVGPIVLVGSVDNPIQATDFSINNTKGRGRFHVPIFQYPDIEDRVLQEDWNTKDIKHNGVYKTFLEVNFDLSAAIIKAKSTQSEWTWQSVQQWCEHKGSIVEMKISPYFYTDEYGRDLIAGQLRYLETYVESDTTADNQINKDSISAHNTVAQSQLVNVVYALGLTPKDAIKLLLEEV